MKKILVLALLAACGDNHAGPTPPPDSSIDAAPARVRAVVVTPSNNFVPGEPGVLGSLDVMSKTVTTGAGPAMAVGSDPVLRKVGDELFIVNRAQNNVTILDANDLHLVEQIGTGAGSNPQDVAVFGDKLFVPTFGNKGMVILTRGSAAIVEADLSVDDPDRKPNCNSIYRIGALAYVSCELLNDSIQSLPPRGPGKVYVIDATSHLIVRTAALINVNPFGLFEQIPEFAPHAGDLVIPTVNFANNSGCVERITTGATAASAGCLVTNAALGNFASRVDFYAPQLTGPVSAAIVVPQVMYAVVPRTDFMGSNIRVVDLSDNQVRPDAINPGTQALVDVAVCPDTQIVVSDAPSSPTGGAGGLRIYQGSIERTTAALAVGLKPSSSHGLICY